MAPSPPSSQPYAAERTPGQEFAEALAALARSLAFYPEVNSRVQANLDQAELSFRNLHASRPARPSEEVLVVFTRKEVAVDGERHEIPEGSSLQWLSERMEGCGLAGVALQTVVRAKSLLDFCRQVLDAYRRSALDREFEAAAAEPLPGVRPLPLRFEGTFDGLPRGAEDDLRAHVAADEKLIRNNEDQLAARLLRHPKVHARVQQIAQGFSSGGAEVQEIRAIELIARIVRALPLEAVLSPDTAVERTLQILDLVEKQRAEEGDSDDPLGRALLAAGLRLCGRSSSTLPFGLKPAEAPAVRKILSPGVRGHPLDEGISDDLDALLTEIQGLPPASSSDLRLLRAEDPVEELGVYLHYLVNVESDPEAELVQAAVAPLATTAGSAERKVIGRYIQALRNDAGEPVPERFRRRMLSFLQTFSLTKLLSEYGAFSADLALALFPNDFGLYLESLDLRNPRDHADLSKVLEALGPERVAGASAALVRDAKVLEPGRARRLLGRPDRAFAPVARIVLARGDNLLKSVVAGYVRGLGIEQEEASLLHILSDEELPRDYLADLLDPPQTPTGKIRQHERIAEILCGFIESAARLSPRSGRRLAAIRQLALFQSPRATRLLRRLAHGRRMLFLPFEPAEVRVAARASLACHV